MHYLTRRFEFSASHSLCSQALSEDEAEDAYGPCRNIHGHNYVLEVTVRGEIDPRTGFFCNVMDLKTVVDELVADPCEHVYLNDLPLFADMTTTMEGIASRIWQVVEPVLADKGMELYEILVAETRDNVVRLRKD